MPTVLHQHPQQLLLGFGELHQPAVPAKVHPLKIKGKGAHRQGRGERGDASPELCVYSGPEYRQREGLGDVVVRTRLQPGDLVQLQIVGGEQDHRRGVALRAHLAQQIQTAAVGEIYVQNQQVEPFFRQRFPGLGQAGLANDGCLRSRQSHGNSPPQGLVILQKKNVFHVRSSSFVVLIQSTSSLQCFIIAQVTALEHGNQLLVMRHYGMIWITYRGQPNRILQTEWRTT